MRFLFLYIRFSMNMGFVSQYLILGPRFFFNFTTLSSIISNRGLFTQFLFTVANKALFPYSPEIIESICQYSFIGYSTGSFGRRSRVAFSRPTAEIRNSKVLARCTVSLLSRPRKAIEMYHRHDVLVYASR